MVYLASWTSSLAIELAICPLFLVKHFVEPWFFMILEGVRLLAPCDFLSLSAACCQSMSELRRSEPLTQGFIWVVLVIVHRFWRAVRYLHPGHWIPWTLQPSPTTSMTATPASPSRRPPSHREGTARRALRFGRRRAAAEWAGCHKGGTDHAGGVSAVVKQRLGEGERKGMERESPPYFGSVTCLSSAQFTEIQLDPAERSCHEATTSWLALILLQWHSYNEEYNSIIYRYIYIQIHIIIYSHYIFSNTLCGVVYP